jgi:transcription elongation factor Elf1
MDKSYSISNFKFLTNCPLCSCQYDSKETRILSKQDDLMILHLTCSRCNGSIMVAVSVGVFGVTAVSVLTDAIGDDLEKISGLGRISADDALEMHEFLENFNGKLVKVL